jgi:hypothetical protein
MPRVCFQQQKTLVGAGAYFARKGKIFVPEIGGGVVLHRALKRPKATVLFVVQSALNRGVESPRRKIGQKASVHRLRKVLLKPHE